jgi:hypothetical protein
MSTHRFDFSIAKSFVFIATLTAVAVGVFSPANARMTLNQCGGKNHSCRMACFVNSPIPPGSDGVDTRLRECLSRCTSGHALCVDAVLTMSREGSGPSPKPAQGAVLPGGGLLEAAPGFNHSGPAATGTVAPRPAAPTASGPIIR